jgi:hypothetical protein
MRNRRTLLGALALVALVLGGIVVARVVLEARATARYTASRAARAPTSVDTLGTLPEVLRESSGLAVSRRFPGVFWTHNDSGDKPRFFAVDGTGGLLGTWDVSGAEAVDWEDLDLGPCPGEASAASASGSCLYLADTGDNGRDRDTLTVYVVAEPDPADSARTVTPLGRLRFSYPDERHDVEALAVHPDGDVVLVTKGRTPRILLYRLPAAEVAAAVRADTPIRLAPGSTLPIVPDRGLGRLVTGASFDPSGATLAVRTYTEIFFFPWPLPAEPGADPASCFVGRMEPQGEAVAWQDEAALILSSETDGRDRGRLLRVRCAVSAGPARE